MNKLKKAKHISSLDIAKVLGVEKEYEKKVNEEIEKTRKDFLESDFVEPEK